MDEGTELHIVPNGDLQFVPEKIAREKVLRLGAAARILKDAATEEGAGR
jgi:5-methyltetrahydropteroyltriglutamate--homocysteine methyltransferase